MPASSRNSRSAEPLGDLAHEQDLSVAHERAADVDLRGGVAGAVGVEPGALARDLGGQPRDLLVALDVVGVGRVRQPRLRDVLQAANPVDPGVHLPLP